MKIVIERIENDILVAELPNGQFVNVPFALIPDAIEGDVYLVEKDTTETEERRARINRKMNSLFVD